MAIGRVAGPMLLPTLDRQGVSLNFVTDPGTGEQSLLYLDFSNFRLGVNTTVTTERLTVDGNISVNAYIKTTHTNQHLYIQADGTAQAIVSNINVLKGNINSTDIGSTVASTAKFTTANTSGKLTANTIQGENLTPGRIVFSDGNGLNDDPDLLFFTGNNTFYATTIESAGTVGYANLNITGEFNYLLGTDATVPFFAANGVMIVDSAIRFFKANSTFRANSIQLYSKPVGGVLFMDGSNVVSTSDSINFIGSTFYSNGITRPGNLSIADQTITGLTTGGNIVLSPQGFGSVDVANHRVIRLAEPVLPDDAVTKDYVDSRISASSVNTIAAQNSFVKVLDNGTVANVELNLNGTTAAFFTDTINYISDYTFYDNQLNTIAGEMVLIAADNNRVRLQVNSAVTVPIGLTTQRPGLPAVGDLRFNTELPALEWYTGSQWDAAATAVNIASQPITPNGIDNIFTLTQPADTESVLININGVIQQPGAYTVVGTTLTFTEVPLVTDIIEIRFLAGALVYASNPIFINSNYSNVQTTGTTVDSFYVTQYRTAIYDFSAKNTALGQFQAGEIYLIHDNVTANAVVTVKTTVGTATPLMNWTTSISGLGLVSLVATAASATGNTYVKLSRTYFNDN